MFTTVTDRITSTLATASGSDPTVPDSVMPLYVDGARCAHGKGHVGCHSAGVDPTTDKYKHRWNDKP